MSLNVLVLCCTVCKTVPTHWAAHSFALMGRPAMATCVPSICKGPVTLWALVSLLPVDSHRGGHRGPSCAWTLVHTRGTFASAVKIIYICVYVYFVWSKFYFFIFWWLLKLHFKQNLRAFWIFVLSPLEPELWSFKEELRCPVFKNLKLRKSSLKVVYSFPAMYNPLHSK